MDEFGFMGNTNGNLANGGYVADFGETILMSLKDGLYILDKTTTEWEKIYDHEVKFINVSENFIYFLEGKHTICEMGIMDSSVYAVVDRHKNAYDEIYYVGLMDEDLYYATFWGESVYRMNIIEGEEMFLFHTVALNFALDPYYLYYSDDRDGLVRRLPLDEVDSFLAMAPEAKTNMWLEYQGYSMDYGIELLKKGLDRKIEVNDLVMEEVFGNDKTVFYMNLDEEWLYYAGTENDQGDGAEDAVNLYRVNMEDLEEDVLTTDDIDYLNVQDGLIFYRNNSDEGSLFVINSDGTIKRRVTDFPVSHIHIVESWVFFRNEEENDAFYRLDLEDLSIVKVRDYYGIK